MKQAITLPESENFSDGFRSLITYSLSPEVASRPSMKDVLEHEYLANTEETHPTRSLAELVKDYYAWLFGGGQRASLFMPGGAAAATEDPDTEIQQSDDWNFSMTQDFEKRVSTILEIPDLSDLSVEELEGEETPKQAKDTIGTPRSMTTTQKANFESRVNRGAADLSNLFDQSGPEYEFKTKTDFVPMPEPRRTSDLPFRAMAEDRPTSIASNVIDLGDFDEEDYAVAAPKTGDNIQTTYADTPRKNAPITLADASTLKQKRADSKGPRDPSSQSLTAKRASSADDAAGRATGTASFDFAAAQQDWTVKDKGKAPELQEAAEITPSAKKGHATMEWSFADAMKGAGPRDEPESAPAVTQTFSLDEPGPEEPSEVMAAKAKARATLDWSFSDAMSELDTTGNTETPATRTTPSRPGIQRMMTMPVTHDDFETAEHQPPRPSTSLSEAISEHSESSADHDPFTYDHDHAPGPDSLDAAGASSFLTSRGRSLLSDDVSQSSQAANVSQGVSYPLGRPPFAGVAGFPGPAAAPGGRQRSHERQLSSSTATSGGRTVVEVPETAPPGVGVLAGGASDEDVEVELGRLLEAFQGSLGAAGGAVGPRGRGRRREESGEEWTDEE